LIRRLLVRRLLLLRGLTETTLHRGLLLYWFLLLNRSLLHSLGLLRGGQLSLQRCQLCFKLQLLRGLTRLSCLLHLGLGVIFLRLFPRSCTYTNGHVLGHLGFGATLLTYRRLAVLAAGRVEVTGSIRGRLRGLCRTSCRLLRVSLLTAEDRCDTGVNRLRGLG
jgi:hypothetical protein